MVEAFSHTRTGSFREFADETLRKAWRLSQNDWVKRLVTEIRLVLAQRLNRLP